MAWIKLHGDIWESWKIPTLCATLGISEPQAVGHLVSLWCFTERNAWRDGDLSKWGERGIARAARWAGEPGKLINALKEACFLDNLKIHNWTQHQAAMIHDRERRFPAKSPLNPRLDKIRVDKRREETTPAQSASPFFDKKTEPALPGWLIAMKPTWDAFVEMREHIKKPLGVHGINLAIKELMALSKQGNDPQQVIERSTFNQWAGLFPIPLQERRADPNWKHPDDIAREKRIAEEEAAWRASGGTDADKQPARDKFKELIRQRLKPLKKQAGEVKP